MHVPQSHQLAFKSAFGEPNASQLIPSAESGVVNGPLIPSAVLSPAIHEKVKPKMMHSLIHSAVKSANPDAGQGGGQPSLGGLAQLGNIVKS
jgi:hypothetical protein